MEIYSSAERFTKKDGHKFSAQVVLVNFKRMLAPHKTALPEVQEIQQDGMLHAVVGLYDVSLPDLDTDPIYSTLCAAGANTIVVLRSVEDVLEQRKCELATTGGIRKSRRKKTEFADINRTAVAISEEAIVSDVGNGVFDELYSSSSSSEQDSCSDEDTSQSLTLGREAFLKEAHQRRLLDPSSAASVGIEHRLLACATFSKVSIKPGETAVQISLIAVRRSFRACGIGRYLMLNMKDYSLVGHYDVLLCYADHKATNFFHRYGFTDNPVIAHKWRHLTDPWDNSTLMSYIAPFSGPALSLGANTSTAISNMEQHLERWLQEGFSQHYQQLSFMERLRNEIILLHAKVQSQEEVISALTAELDHVSVQKQVLEKEFVTYRKQANQMLQKTSRQQAEDWD